MAARAENMSRSSQQRQLQKLQQQQMAENEAAAAAAELFDMFCVATTMRQVLGLHRNMCDLVGLRPAPLNEFYPKLKAKIRSWKAQALWKKFDARSAHRVYAKGTAATGIRVLVIGAGPCGLRTAIEAQLLGAKVVVVEKRDRISRNNVLHLWPFVITDLRNLGAKKFYGKFCAGSIDHISIRQLQCILLKVALLLGVEVHEGVSFEGTIEPNGDGCGWRASVTPADHAVSYYEFDVLIGADGKRNTLEGFKRKEFRGKLAIAITANFINKKTEAEAKVEEISGVAFIFNQSFFKELYHTTGIDLENIVYYKDETHYFVMTAKKHSLIDKGVIMQDFADPAELLAPANVNAEKLLDYAREAAEFSTKYQMPNLEFAVNHYGKPDVAMFDFTSMFAAETSCRVIVRKGFRLLQCLVGDSLLEPFWPTGSGCARGFLSSMDAAYAIKLWSNPQNSSLGVLAQRESIYRLLNQTTPENLQRDIGSYTVDPATRYPNLNRTSVNVWQVKHLIDTDDKTILEQTFMDNNALERTQVDTPLRRKRRSGDSMPLSIVLLRWICAQLHSHEFTKSLKEVSDVFTHGKVLCALINRYRPDLIDFSAIKNLNPIECNDIAFKVLDKELNIPRIMSGKDAQNINGIESKVWLSYLEQICEMFRGEIPHIKHPKMDFPELREKYCSNLNVQHDFSKLLQKSTKQKGKASVQDIFDPKVSTSLQQSVVLNSEEKLKRQRKHASEANASTKADFNVGSAPAGQGEIPRRAKKRRSAEKAANIEERQKRLQEIELNRQERQSKRQQQRYQQTQNFYKSLHMLQANSLLRESDEASSFEDYSIFLYRQQAPEFNDRVKQLERKLLFPDRDRSDIPSALPRCAADEQFCDRIKSMEQRIHTSRNTCGTEKKPKDLMRAIGKIDSSDWNVREIEKKIEQSKRTEMQGPKGREKVPKWSKEQFVARQHKMSKPLRQDSGEEKFKEIDKTLKNLDKQLKEGSVLEVGERGRNKVASIAGQFVKKDDTSDEKNLPNLAQKPSPKVALAFKKQAAFDRCHFCKQTVYLMEKISTEGLTLHRSCLKCHHCHTNLRPGGYAFDRDDPSGRFYCTQHFRLPAKAVRPIARKSGQRKTAPQPQSVSDEANTNIEKNYGNLIVGIQCDSKTPDKLRGQADNVAQLDLLDRGQTPERIEFENTDAMSDGEPSEEHIIDENEWSGRNFLPESNKDSESDLSSTEEESDSDVFEEANESPLAVQTLQLATDWIGKQDYSDSEDFDDFYDSSDGILDDGKDDTDGEELKKARELRREEVRLLPLPANLPTDTETELKFNVTENKENIEISPSAAKELNKLKASNLNLNKSQNIGNSFINEKMEANHIASALTKTDIEKIEQNSDLEFTKAIDDISEKLHRLNSFVKVTKDIDSLNKENLVKNDIQKKLTLKEQWLANNTLASASLDTMKTQFDAKIEKLRASGKKPLQTNATNNDDRKESKPLNPELDSANMQLAESAKITQQSSPSCCRNKTFRQSNQTLVATSDKKIETAAFFGYSSGVSRKYDVSSTHSDNCKNTIPRHHLRSDSKMQLEQILDNVKKINLSTVENCHKAKTTSYDDIGKMVYDAENRFSPKPEKKMAAKLKEVEASNFASTMDSIKSQIDTPTLCSQTAILVDLSKYFPNPKLEKTNSKLINKNQKNLKDVDLTKYFPASPVAQRRSSVETVAERLKKSQTEKFLAPEKSVVRKQLPSSDSIKLNKPKSGETPTLSTVFSLHEHQLDGAIDVADLNSAVATTTATATTTKKGNIKIIKKSISKGTKAAKTAADESDRILDEIFNTNEDEMRSPSLEYKKLFGDEKSPSDDISDKIERILEDTGFDLGIEQKTIDGKRRKVINKLKSADEAGRGCKRNPVNLSQLQITNSASVTKGDDKASPKGVQNILQHFESFTATNSGRANFKLQRMESSTNNLNRSHESSISREFLSDLEKTMDYLKTEWREEAKDFLQKKRKKFYSQKRIAIDEVITGQKQKKSRLCELLLQNPESVLAKFSGKSTKTSNKMNQNISAQKRKSPGRNNSEFITDNNTKDDQNQRTTLEKQLLKKFERVTTDQVGPEPPHLQNIANACENYLRESGTVIRSEEISAPSRISRKDFAEETTPSPSEIVSIWEGNFNSSIQPLRNNSIEFIAIDPGNRGSTPRQSIAPSSTPPEHRRPLVEDIRNLPKFGCDKSLNNSRRGSQSSLLSRRQSEASLAESLEKVDDELTKSKTTKFESRSPEIGLTDLARNIDSCSPQAGLKNVVAKKSFSSSDHDEYTKETSENGEDPSRLPRRNLQINADLPESSEDEGIEKLFSQFSDNMLVDVEFDSNDELISITPRAILTKKNGSETEGDREHCGKPESLEKEKNIGCKEPKSSILLNSIDSTVSIHLQNQTKGLFSSREPSITLPPERLKTRLSMLDPIDMSPSVQDVLQEIVLNHAGTESSRNDAEPDTILPKYSPRVYENENATGAKVVAQSTKEQEVNVSDKSFTLNDTSIKDPSGSFNSVYESNKALFVEVAADSTREQGEYSSTPNPIGENTVELNEEKRENCLLLLKTETKTGLAIPKGRVDETILKEHEKLSNLRNLRNPATHYKSTLNSINSQVRDVQKIASTETGKRFNKSSEDKKEYLSEITKNENQMGKIELVNTKNDSEIIDPEKIPTSETFKTDLSENSYVNAIQESTSLCIKNPEINSVESTNSRIKKEASAEKAHDNSINIVFSKQEFRSYQESTHSSQSSNDNVDKSKDNTSKTIPSELLSTVLSSNLTSFDQKATPKSELPEKEELKKEELDRIQKVLKTTESDGFDQIENSKEVMKRRKQFNKIQKVLQNELEIKSQCVNKDKEHKKQKFREHKELLMEPEKEFDKIHRVLKPKESECLALSSMPISKSTGTIHEPDKETQLQLEANTKNPVFQGIPLESSFPETSLSQITRRSLASENQQADLTPVLSPLPKKLQIPNNTPRGRVNRENGENNDYEGIPEIFKNRPWPKAEIETKSDEHKFKLSEDRRTVKPSPSPLLHKNYEYIGEIDPVDENFRKQSQYHFTQSPQNSYRTPSLQSSIEKDAKSFPVFCHLDSSAPCHVNKSNMAHASVDAGTRILLDRSKRLHNLKRNFINERVAERNPYMKTLSISSDESEDGGDRDKQLESYRPRNHTTSASRNFPTTLIAETTTKTKRADYLSAWPTSTDYGVDRGYTLTIPSRIPRASGYASTAVGNPVHASFWDDFRRTRPQQKERREFSKEPCVQSDSDSSSSVKVEQNSATEISTDSEFDHDEVKRETPKIFIDDSHIRKPTKVQVKTSMITAAANSTTAEIKDRSSLLKYPTQHLTLQPKFKPLVQVDPSVLCTNRTPLVNPRPGEYLLNKTASTEGIASKKSLELKKRYLLGEPTNGNRIQKSGSASVLDSKIKSFHSNISECQKLLNPGNDKCSSAKAFLNPAKSGKTSFGDISNLAQPAAGNVLNNMKMEITIEKNSSLTSTVNEKENIFVNSKNELNKGMEYSETANVTLVESLSRKTPTTPVNQTIMETIDLVTPEKKMSIIDLTQVETPTKMLESNVEVIQNLDIVERQRAVSGENCCHLLDTDSNKIIDLTKDSPIKKDKATEDAKPDISKDAKGCIPDIIQHIEACENKSASKIYHLSSPNGDEDYLLSGSYDEEKKDSPEKRVVHDCENNDLQIQVPNIPWNVRKTESRTSNSSSNCSSNTSSIEDIQHFVLESTTSPDTQTGAGSLGGSHRVPRVAIHDTAGELMQIDSLMIIDGKYIANPEELKLLEISVNFDVRDEPVTETTEIEDEPDIEPVTATPEPTEHTVIETAQQTWQLPEQRAQKIKPVDLKFDTKNENKVETLKNLPLIVERTTDNNWKAVKPLSLNLMSAQKLAGIPSARIMSPGSPVLHVIDNDKTPTAELISRASDSETEPTGTGQALTETELSDWTADDCISENFIEIECALNTNKGTIKRNKKGGRKNRCTKFNEPSLCSKSSKPYQAIAPVTEFEGILRNLDIEEIDFMDTGSEGSYRDAYSATNTAMLRNSGYIEFVEHAPKVITSYTKNDQAIQKKAKAASEECTSIMTKRNEVLGIDYIVQGAYIMKGCDNQHDLLKTPVNEQPLLSSKSNEAMDSSKPTNAPPLSQMHCSTHNEVYDDSFGLMSNSGANFKPITTDDSEALTVVTSPLESSSRRIAAISAVKQHTLPTPSSSDKNLKSSTISSYSANSESTAPVNAKPTRFLLPPEEETETAAKIESASAKFQTPDGILYEDYVRALQQKITQISNARDSLDTRKHRRKSSKDEVLVATFSSDTQTVIQQTLTISGGQSESAFQHQCPPVASMPTESIAVESKVAFQAPIQKVPEIPTLTSRLEEITKERTKQKDIIHDLVMDKLQSKKQLNAEKRLHRSRQRTILASGSCGYTSGSSISPTPKLAAAATTTDTNCTSQAHYHVSTSAPIIPKERVTKRENFSYSSSKENKALHKCPTYISPYISDIGTTPTRTVSLKQRPLSEHLDAEQKDGGQLNKLTKAPSFSYIMSTSACNLNVQPSKDNKKELFKAALRPTIEALCKKPVLAPNNRGSISTTIDANDEQLNMDVKCAERMRSEARARARLKSNNELGLSPEEKMLLLRKRLNLESSIQQNRPDYVNFESNSIRNRKIISSKSTNDLAATLVSHFDNKKLGYATNANDNEAHSAAVVDFTSDPNLLHSYTSAQAVQMKPSKSEKANRRQKDPDRRKSIIQSLSNFFHMGSNNGARKEQTGIGAVNSFNTSQTEGPCGNCAGTTSNGSTDGVFSRFRLAPKLKEESKDKDVSSDVTASSNKSASSSSPTKTHHDRSNSQNCISSIRTRIDLGDNCRLSNGKNEDNRSQLASTGKQSTSSPQLFVKLSSPVTSDEQTPPPIPPLPQHYQRSDDESFATETREQRKQRSISKGARQAELKRLRIAQEIQREQEEIEVQLKELEARGVLIEKALRGEGHHVGSWESNVVGVNDENLLKELLEIWRNITQLKKRDEELGIRQQELQLEHRHAQLKEELNLRLSSSKLDKSSADVAAEGAILNEMLEIVAKRASLRPTTSPVASNTESNAIVTPANSASGSPTAAARKGSDNVNLAKISGQSLDNNESNI